MWQNFREFSSDHSKVSKIWILIGPFCAKYKTFDLKKEWSFMTLNSHAKFEGKLTCGLEKDMMNLSNFYQSTWKYQIGLHRMFLSKVENAWAKNLFVLFELFVMTLKNDKKSEEELTFRFKIDIRNLTKFELSTWKSQKCGL